MPTCISCGSTNFAQQEPYIYISDFFRRSFPGLYKLQCCQCGLHQVDHDLINVELLLEYYKTHYRKSARIAAATSKEEQLRLEARARALSDLARRLMADTEITKIFEVGSGYGANLLRMQRQFPKATLYTDEPNSEIRAKEIKFASVDDGPYDIVLISHVLEHLVSPLNFLARSIAGLRTSGLLLIEVPNEGGGNTYQEKAGNPFHEPHLTFFDIRTLQDLFDRNFPGLECVHLGSAGPTYSQVKARRLSKQRGARAVIRKLAGRHPALLHYLQRSFDRLASFKLINSIEFPDFPPSDKRVFIRIAYKKPH